MGGDEGLRYGGGLRPGKICGDFRKSSFVDDDVLGVRTASADAEDTLSFTPEAGFGAEGRDHACELESGNVLG
ncbi:MAG: hypothetical protein JWN45_3119 [Acidobacteriaceae bacterium]|nr:hypothetical protein [Acidobacteriaceae bacterium]